VYPSGRWICYRCDQHGDVIAFVQQIENLTFREAAARLGGDRAGSTHPIRRARPVPRLSRTRQRENVLGRDEYRVLAAATDLYANQLFTDELALGYMADRGFPRGLLERYRVGYSRGDELVAYLHWRRLPLGAAVRAGLITADGREFLAGRIVFPELRDGQTVWLIGRVLPTGNGRPSVPGPTYLGLPGCKPLLGWGEAIRDTRGVVVVEGPMDLLALRLWGVPGLALAGNAVRDDKLALLDQFRRVYVALDQDAGGRQGTERLATHVGSRAVRIELPPGVKDVADLAKLPDGDGLFRAAILHAVLSASLQPGMTQNNPAEGEPAASP
jgi:DNA primase